MGRGPQWSGRENRQALAHRVAMQAAAKYLSSRPRFRPAVGSSGLREYPMVELPNHVLALGSGCRGLRGSFHFLKYVGTFRYFCGEIFGVVPKKHLVADVTNAVPFLLVVSLNRCAVVRRTVA